LLANVPGQRGGNGLGFFSSIAVAYAGKGGDSNIGMGGTVIMDSSASNFVGNPGINYGGGGGGSTSGTTSAVAGAAGANGVAIFTEFI
jgi:hypothetical protein